MMKTLPILVGIDGSVSSLQALDWAINEAKDKQCGLQLLSAYSAPIFATIGLDAGYATIDLDIIKNNTENMLNKVVADTAKTGVTVTALVKPGDPNSLLIEHSDNAQLVVLGSRGRGGFVGRLLGNVSGTLPAHASCPTVVVPNLAKRDWEEVQQKIVVGVDGSQAANCAVDFAVSQALQKKLPLELVCVLPACTALFTWLPATLDVAKFTDDVTKKLDTYCEQLRLLFPELEIFYKVCEGGSAQVLVEESAGAQLLVLGSRGQGGFSEMLLGSTANTVLHHTKCPIVVVPNKNS